MRRYGYTAKGTARWYCSRCRMSSIWTRPDTSIRHERQQFIRWLAGKASLSEIAKRHKITRRALTKRFRPYFAKQATWQSPRAIHTLTLDGTYIHGRALVALLALTDDRAAYWMFAHRETAETWGALLVCLPRPQVVVCDGQKGLHAILEELWPQTAIQRCHFHVAKLARRHLTLKPKTEAGREAKTLIHLLPPISTLHLARQWQRAYLAWEERYATLLAERTYHHDGTRMHWWYTHRNLRGVRSLVRGALPHLFTYLRFPGTPNTTNHLEGGVNAGIAEALRLHRGLRLHQKKTLVSILLADLNRRRNATRKFS